MNALERARLGKVRWTVLCCAVLLASCGRKELPVEPQRSVKLWTVQGVQTLDSAEYAAEVRARTELRLGFQVPGKLLRRTVEVGEWVKSGQLLAEIDAQDYALGAAAAQAQVVAARTQRDVAAADYQRFERLKNQNFISEAEWTRHQAALRASQANLDQALAQAQAQNHQVTYARLVANVSGVITSVEAESGQVLAAGMPVVRLAQDGPRDVVFSVPESRVKAMQVGQSVMVRAWAQSDREVQAQVREVAASADPAGRTFQIKAGLPAQTDWPLGSTVTVRWDKPKDPADSQQAIVIPTTALYQKEGSTLVWRYDPAQRTVHAQPVQLGGMDGNNVKINTGLEPGMQIVMAGVHVLSDGQSVHVYRRNMPSGGSGQVPGAMPSDADSAQ